MPGCVVRVSLDKFSFLGAHKGAIIFISIIFFQIAICYGKSGFNVKKDYDLKSTMM